MRDDEEKLKVFDKNGVYLPMKKVGKTTESRADRSGQSGSYHVEPDCGQGISEWCAGETDSGSEAE